MKMHPRAADPAGFAPPDPGPKTRYRNMGRPGSGSRSRTQRCSYQHHQGQDVVLRSELVAHHQPEDAAIHAVEGIGEFQNVADLVLQADVDGKLDPVETAPDF